MKINLDEFLNTLDEKVFNDYQLLMLLDKKVKKLNKMRKKEGAADEKLDRVEIDDFIDDVADDIRDKGFVPSILKIKDYLVFKSPTVEIAGGRLKRWM